MTLNTVRMTPALAVSLLDDYDNFMFDCDGVVWLGESLIPGVKEALEQLSRHGKKVVFITNNSSRSRDTYVQKFASLGITVTKDQLYPTCYSAAAKLQELGIASGSKVWVLGELGIEHELRDLGYTPLGGTSSKLNTPFSPDHPLLQVDPDVKAVVVGSTKEFNYMRIALTLQYLLHDNKLLPFVGTNIDRTYPGPKGLILPAGGSVVNYMEYTANRNCIDVGKPSTTFLDSIVEANGFDKKRTLMVGDTLYTDIKFGNDGGLGMTVLVLTGGSNLADLETAEPDILPLVVVDSLGDMGRYWAEAR